ncbi:glycosyltransferase family 4 protein [Streptomyces yaanensis]|uniref:D-inositol 3-phosphate glycosyltransferase n=1 Tax=Streptomyces yaanensis TaxID=1142239 RepID=A0ABV7S9Y0_9ACTN|nr:glycosyltransferase family 4 protein [Streptomyces sp. CGMCC 4.7035]WNB96745.1 glycosyltransferase family 4 protein [Streptomyces sp. CGMCC 4.7035]
MRWYAPGGRHLNWHRLARRAAGADAVVLEQALHNLEAFPLLLRQSVGHLARRRGRPVAFWGHGRTFTKPQNRLETWGKEVLTRRGAWFFSYTDEGAAHVASRGFPRERITVVQNSIDTAALSETCDRARSPGTTEFAEAEGLRRQHDLTAGRTALFVGGLDAPKRIPFLLDTARRITEELPGFRLLVAGDGPARGLVEEAAARPGSGVIAVGRAVGRSVALLGAVSDIMLMPGRVGLCAVDSFALRTPIVTTAWPWHAPEFEYLADARNAVVSVDDPAAYATAVVTLLRDHKRLAALADACSRDASVYTVQNMAARFSKGILQMLSQFEAVGRRP